MNVFQFMWILCYFFNIVDFFNLYVNLVLTYFATIYRMTYRIIKHRSYQMYDKANLEWRISWIKSQKLGMLIVIPLFS